MQNEIDVQVLKVVVTKLDDALTKITDSTNGVSRLIAIHDEKIHYIEKNLESAIHEHDAISSKINISNAEIINEINKVSDNIDIKLKERAYDNSVQYTSLVGIIDRINTRLLDLEKWRWYVAGTLVIVIFLITNVSNISELIHILRPD